MRLRKLRIVVAPDNPFTLPCAISVGGNQKTPMLSGLKIVDVKVGDGPIAERDSRVTVRYTGYLNRGEVFQRDVVVSFTVGERNIIAGFAHGVQGMRVGGRRRIRVGPHLAYRDRGVPGVVPPNAKLTFDVELIAVE